MTPRVHGGNVSEAARRYGFDESDILDFSANVNPLGPSPASLKAARTSLAEVDRYPDSDTPDLKTACAWYFGIRPDQVLCGNGSTGLIHLIPRVFRPKRVLITTPTFTEYAAAVADAGGSVISFPLREHNGFRVDPRELAPQLNGVDMAILCNPNNPTGRLVKKVEMKQIVQSAFDAGVKLVVDEAFMDFAESESIARFAAEFPHVICIRAFTKFFALAGLRIGYLLSHEENIHALRAGQEPWAVSLPAERAAVAALHDERYISKTHRLVTRERAWLQSMLRQLPGIEPFDGSANFLLAKLTSGDARDLVHALGRRGILIRDCSSFAGLGNQYVRIAVRTRRENERLAQALSAALAG